VQDGDTLVDRLTALTTPELLTGDNKYHCSKCDQRCDAERSVSVSETPDVVHFSLLRFNFDIKSMSRKKSKAVILYPRSTLFGGVQYDLRAVVTHLGTSVSFVTGPQTHS
jgi:ubiquitin carboxyl-terminal hydrolase 48